MEHSRYIKTTIIGWVLLITIIGFYVSLFILRERLGSGVWLAAIFCVLPYAIIYFHRQWKYGIALLGLVSIGLGFYLGWNTFLALGFIAALIGFYKTAHTIHEDVHNKIKVSAYDIFTGESAEKFVTYMTLAYVFTFMAFYQSFNLTCETLYSYANQMVDIVLLRANPEKVDEIKGQVANFFTTNVDSILGQQALEKVTQDVQESKPLIRNGNTSDVMIPIPAIDPAAKYKVNNNQASQTKDSSSSQGSLVDSIQLHNAPDAAETMDSRTLLQAIESYRKLLIEQTIEVDDQIEHGVCSMIVGQIKDKYQNPEFRLSVIFMMYFLIRPAMEVALNIISYANRGIFQIMFKLGWFRKYEDWEVSENLE